MGAIVKSLSDFLEIGANSTVGRVEFYFYPSSTASGPPSPQGEGKGEGMQERWQLVPQGEGKKKGKQAVPPFSNNVRVKNKGLKKTNKVVCGYRKRRILLKTCF